MASGQEPRARRAYRSPRREQQAGETRAVVLDAAVRLFAEHGWAATGMRDVAREAGVSVETVYAGFRSKSDLLMAALDVAVVGDAEPQALAERPEFALLASGTRQERIAAAARLVTAIHRRTAGVHLALREAAASNGDLARRLRENQQRRRTSIEQGMTRVAGRPVTDEERDGMWAVLGVEVYHLLTAVSGWSPQQYESWVAGAVDRLLDADADVETRGEHSEAQ